ncbi:MAG: c-type heme family protein [Arcobacter sp.]|uniref:c-type heme family protein n=1 Tax=Arcobacter sp. TaxID=1872629 RepID=UPI003B009506
MSLFFIIGITIKKSYQIQESSLTESLKNKAETIFNLIVDMRHWNAQYDGVYVKSEKLQPNPYLNPNYIKSEHNEKLVWINPAFMTRQISDIASQRDGFKLKITSKKLININNAPDEDEKKILDYFEENPNKRSYWNIKDNEFKFMGALKIEKDCLKCHSKQGYKVGDIRGGISVTFDVTKEFEQLSEINKEKTQTIIFLIMAAIGGVITLIIHETMKRRDEQKISKLNESLEMKVNELDEFNKTLHKKVQEEVNKQREKENLLIQQSKMAALGEMIGNIAHQWRQPISAVSAIMMNIKWTAISEGMNKEFIDDRMKEANEQLGYMSQTIDDFRNFFKPNKEKESFDLDLEVRKTYKILKDALQHNNINFQIFSNKEIIAYGYPSEFSQVILNIISNAKDVLIERNIEKPKIEVHILKDEENIYCKITDNAGGIEDKNINKIFEPYFTTKELRGTGIGLYISKEIIEKHMNGSLIVKNNKLGAEFVISIPIYKEKV